MPEETCDCPECTCETCDHDKVCECPECECCEHAEAEE